MNYPPFKGTALSKKPASNVTRVVHTADNHLRLTHLGSRDRGVDFRNALLSVIDVASQYGAQAIINAGDVMDTAQVQPAVIDDLRVVDERARKAKLPMYTLLGNHDFASPSWLDVQRSLSGGFGDPYGVIPIDNACVKVGALTFYGMPFMAPDLLRQRLSKSVDADVLIWHGSVQEFAGFPVEGMITVEDLTAGQKWKAVLLGDIHITKYFNVDGTLLGYPGATELIKKDEPLEHSCTVIDFDNATGAVVAVEHVPVAHRLVLTLRIDTEDQLDEALEQLIKSQSAAPIVFANYRSDLPAARSRLLQAAGSKALCRLSGYDVATMRLLDGTTPGAAVPRPEDYVTKAIPADQELAAVATALIDPEANVGEVLRQFIATSMA